MLPRIGERTARRFEALAEAEAEVEELMAERLRKEHGQIPPRDLAGAMRNTGVAKAVNVDKSQLLRGNPTQITENRDVDGILRKLAGAGLVNVESVDSTAIELDEPPGQLSPGSDP
jgi:hypothetical protein